MNEYFALDGGAGLDVAAHLAPGAIIDPVEASGLRGRGGAEFTTGIGRLRTAIDDFARLGASDIDIRLVRGPSSQAIRVSRARPPCSTTSNTGQHRRPLSDAAAVRGRGARQSWATVDDFEECRLERRNPGHTRNNGVNPHWRGQPTRRR
jgi:hypothetical protein